MSLRERLKKASVIKETDILSESKFFNKKDMIPTKVPMINVALSGEVDGGLTPGFTMIAGPSKHFKSSFALLMAGTYLNHYADEDATLVFYDSEFGSPASYFAAYGVDPDRVLHKPIKNIEELKFDVSNTLDEIKRGDKVTILIDSLGNLASKKEVEDALDEKSVADMSRSKAFKSLFRIMTPHLNLKDIPLIGINHTYKEIGMFPKDIVSGGTGAYYSADTIWIVGRQQDKDGDGLHGYHFVINVEKSRYVKEKSKIPITVSFDEGVKQWSGLADLALEFGVVTNPSKGWYEYNGKKMRWDDFVDSKEFWLDVLKNSDIKEQIRNKYKLDSSLTLEEVDFD